MCFTLITERLKIPKPEIAKKDITVYKVIRHDGFGMHFNITINGKSEKWVPGTWYFETAPFRESFMNNEQFLVHGNAFHSFITKKDARFYKNCLGLKTKLIELIIPKGSLYYKNNSAYVSSDIIYPHK